jgi:hypothetical protein
VSCRNFCLLRTFAKFIQHTITSVRNVVSRNLDGYQNNIYAKINAARLGHAAYLALNQCSQQAISVFFALGSWACYLVKVNYRFALACDIYRPSKNAAVEIEIAKLLFEPQCETKQDSLGD